MYSCAKHTRIKIRQQCKYKLAKNRVAIYMQLTYNRYMAAKHTWPQIAQRSREQNEYKSSLKAYLTINITTFIETTAKCSAQVVSPNI